MRSRESDSVSEAKTLLSLICANESVNEAKAMYALAVQTYR